MKLMGPLELLLCIFDVVIVDFVWTGERGRRGGEEATRRRYIYPINFNYSRPHLHLHILLCSLTLVFIFFAHTNIIIGTMMIGMPICHP